jgi:effector-binding domain-containing protein
MPAHYAEFLAWLDIEGETPAGPPREIYIAHPGPDGSGDPETFRTEIQFPVSD